MPQPKVSILIATFNASRHLGGCLENIRRQTYPQREVIVADGGSTDGTLDILRDNADMFAHSSSEPDGGIYDAWNKALPRVSGDWVLFRGADDLCYDDEALARAAAGLADAPADALIAYGRAARYDAAGNLLAVWGSPWEQSRQAFFRRMNLPHPSTFHRPEAFRRFGKFDTKFRIAGDYEFLLRVLRESDPHFIDGPPISVMRDGGVSGNANVQVPMETIRALRKNQVRGLPLAQWRQVGVCLMSKARHGALRVLAGRSRAAGIVDRKRRSKAIELSAQTGLPARLADVPALAADPARLLGGVPA